MIKELERVRVARDIAKRLFEEYKALIPMAASPRMDGMPRGSGGGDRNAAIVDLREEALRRYEGAWMAFQEAAKIARREMDTLPPNLYSLCLYYYIGAMTKEETMQVMHISDSTFKRYKANLKEYEPCVTLA